jgi:hypothetical protein
MTVMLSPVPIVAVPSAALAITPRIGPLPSSSVTPRPSTRGDGDSAMTPDTASRRLSSSSPADPVAIVMGSGSEAFPVSTTLVVWTAIVRRLK